MSVMKCYVVLFRQSDERLFIPFFQTDHFNRICIFKHLDTIVVEKKLWIS